MTNILVHAAAIGVLGVVAFLLINVVIGAVRQFHIEGMIRLQERAAHEERERCIAEDNRRIEVAKKRLAEWK